MLPPHDLSSHCALVVRKLFDGQLVPFLGAGANMCERPEGEWPDRFLPTGVELAEYLANEYGYPPDQDRRDLSRVAQYVDLETDEAVLFADLRKVFVRDPPPNPDYLPNKLHRLLAALPGLLREGGHATCGQLIITTNYDDVVETAFASAGEALDVVSYSGGGNRPPIFIHKKPGGEHHEIDDPSTYADFDLATRSVLLKIHGALNREDRTGDRYVITEDHYIDYMTRENAPALIPKHLIARMTQSSFLFLGYALRDWNLRVVLRSIWSERTLRIRSWAIERSPSIIDTKLWQRHEVEILGATLEEWVDAMRLQLELSPDKGNPV